MASHRNIGLAVAVVAFVFGAGYILYTGRPVMQLDQQAAGGATGVGSPNVMRSYVMADVQAHAAPSSCWAAIGGGVYDLTDWIGRHPGGPEVIMALCGTDGTSAFEAQHGGSRRAQAELMLLKIGDLKP